jgi:glycosyltransferase involved in cell wall biosynthesis
MTRSSDLHVAYLVQQFPPEVGAGPARVTEMATRWQAAGAKVTVITGFPSRSLPGRAYGAGDPAYRGRLRLEEDWNGIRVLRSWLYATSKAGLARQVTNNVTFMLSSALHALARLGPVDVLIASEPPLFPHVAGAWVSAARRIPLVLEVRDLWPDYLVGLGVVGKGSLPARLLFRLERRLLKRADSVVAVTDSFRRRIITKGVPATRVHVIPNGVELEQYAPSDEPPPLDAMRRREGEFIAGYLGTFGVGQDLTTIVAAAQLLASEDPSIRFVLVGDGLEQQRVRDRARALNLTNLEICPPLHKDLTRAFYNACDVCLVPLAPVEIFQETVPSKMFEIMACERPVLASLAGEGQRIVEESGGGVVAPPGDARALADALKRLKAMSPSTGASMGRNGREYVARHYARGVLADRYLEILAAVARKRPSPAPLTDPGFEPALSGDIAHSTADEGR